MAEAIDYRAGARSSGSRRSRRHLSTLRGACRSRSGSGGLIGSESVRYFVEQGFDVIGLDNDMRAYFFGPDASTKPVTERLTAELGASFTPLALDIRDADGVLDVFASRGRAIELVVHTAAQPSHDWAASEPLTDFSVNATGTLHLLEATRRHCPEATFVFCSTNKVYGDRPNMLPLEEHATRLELPADHPWFDGIDLTMSIDTCTHSLFGVSKAAADLLVQEYGLYFGIPTCASAAVVSPDPSTPEPSCTGSSPTSCDAP